MPSILDDLLGGPVTPEDFYFYFPFGAWGRRTNLEGKQVPRSHDKRNISPIFPYTDISR